MKYINTIGEAKGNSALIVLHIRVLQKYQILNFSRAILSKHSIHYKNTMCEIFLKNIDNWGFPKPPKILMFSDENLKF